MIRAPRAACLDLAERERRAVARDDVELAPAGAVIALDDLKPAPGEVLNGELLAELTEPLTAIWSHAGRRYAETCDTWVTRRANSVTGGARRRHRIATRRDPRVTRSSLAWRAMLARVRTFAIDGVEPRQVWVEVDIRPGLPAFTIVGLGDVAVQGIPRPRAGGRPELWV